MDIILPFNLYDEEKIVKYAMDIEYDEFAALKLVFIVKHCDLDTYESMADERLQQLLYGWELCTVNLCKVGPDLPENLQYIVKLLAHLSLHVWFSQEWQHANSTLKCELLLYLDYMSFTFRKIDSLKEFNWVYLLNFNAKPWSVPYLQEFGNRLKLNKQLDIEHSVTAASHKDVEYLKQEGLLIAFLRLIKLFNANSWESVKQLSLRVLSAWLKDHTHNVILNLDDKRCLIFIMHIYLMAIFVADDNSGYNIDNMMHNIRFYKQYMRDSAVAHTKEFTPARLIAIVCIRLGLIKNEFFEHFIFHAYDTSFITLYGAISQAYMSYVLGNLLMEMTALNEQDFTDNLEQFKIYINRYVEEREKSEIFLLKEFKKTQAQQSSWAPPITINMGLDFKELICVGNRASNIGNYEDEGDVKLLKSSGEFDRQIDPVFQNIPNNEEVLNFVYEVLAQRCYDGWHFAKIVLLLKIIGHKMNMIETWRYHPGLSTEFMINLEQKLSEHYADMAKIFADYPFMEQELWLTAFYLNPKQHYYTEVKRCGLRNNRRRQNADDEVQQTMATTSMAITSSTTVQRTESKNDSNKYGLLSSTIDAKEIVRMTNHHAPNLDYDPLCKALTDLRLPESVWKDLLTVTFFARNNGFSWALEWSKLLERCKDLLLNNKTKRRFVELNMAEANDRLQYLKIDYEKYKHRPQIDYGTIEEGYENGFKSEDGNNNNKTATDDVEEYDGLEFDCTPKETRYRRGRRPVKRKFWDEESISDKSNEDSDDDSATEYLGPGTRRTRARTAAAIATATFKDEALKKLSECPKEISCDNVELKSNPGKEFIKKIPFEEVLKSRTQYHSHAIGFDEFIDIWRFDDKELHNILPGENYLVETEAILIELNKLKESKKKLAAEIVTKAKDSEGSTRNKNEILNQNTEQDSDSFRSDMSIIAHKDVSELDDSIYQNQTVGNLYEAKEKAVDTPIRSTLFNLDVNCSAKVPISVKSKNLAKDEKKPLEFTRLYSLGSEEQSEALPSKSVFYDNRTKCCRVRLRRLRVDEITSLRQPHVRLERMNTNLYSNVSSKLDTIEETEIVEMRDTIDATEIGEIVHATKTATERTRRKRRIGPAHRCCSEEYSSSGSAHCTLKMRTMKRKRRILKHVTSESSNDAEDENALLVHKRKMIINKRSASGLKLRISALEHSTERAYTESPEQIEFIQLSTSSSSSSSVELISPIVFRSLTPIQEMENVDMTEDPLYEEEVVPFR